MQTCVGPPDAPTTRAGPPDGARVVVRRVPARRRPGTCWEGAVSRRSCEPAQGTHGPPMHYVAMLHRGRPLGSGRGVGGAFAVAPGSTARSAKAYYASRPAASARGSPSSGARTAGSVRRGWSSPRHPGAALAGPDREALGAARGMCGAGRMSIREAARRVGRDVKAGMPM